MQPPTADLHLAQQGVPEASLLSSKQVEWGGTRLLNSKVPITKGPTKDWGAMQNNPGILIPPN